MALDDELDRLPDARGRSDMQPIAALLTIDASHPASARVLYEVGGAYDTAGQELVARGFHEKAQAAGWPNEAIASLLDVTADFVETPGLERYTQATTGNAAHLRSMGRIKAASSTK